jgi:hypothetical protein
MLKRALSGTLGALVIGILTPVLYLLLVGVPGSSMEFSWIVLIGSVTSAILGAIFPKFFGFVFEIYMDF